MKNLLAIVVIFMLASCASVFDTQWSQTTIERKPVYVYLDRLRMEGMCRQFDLGLAEGCVIRTASQCVVFLPADASRALREHEEKHCQGYDHY